MHQKSTKYGFFNIFNLMNSIGLEQNGLTFTTLIDGLSKQGRLEQANEILGSIWNLNQIWLNSYLSAASLLGQGKLKSNIK